MVFLYCFMYSTKGAGSPCQAVKMKAVAYWNIMKIKEVAVVVSPEKSRQADELMFPPSTHQRTHRFDGPDG